MEKRIVVCAILRDAQKRILLCRRAPGRREAGLWEFPGGKLEAGETLAQALARELREELGCDCLIGSEFCRSVHTYTHGCIELVALDATWPGGDLPLRDHDAHAWVYSQELLLHALAPADIPIARQLQNQGNG